MKKTCFLLLTVLLTTAALRASAQNKDTSKENFPSTETTLSQIGQAEAHPNARHVRMADTSALAAPVKRPGLIRRIIDSRIEEMQGKTLVEGMPQALAWRQTLNEDDDALMLEMSAEATRNPQVAAMLIEAESRMFTNACAHLKKQFPHLSDEHIRCCVEITAVMIEGTIYRRLAPLKVPSEQLEPLYQDILNMLFSAK